MFTWLSWELQSGPFMAASSWLVHGWFVASGYSKRKHSHHQTREGWDKRKEDMIRAALHQVHPRARGYHGSLEVRFLFGVLRNLELEHTLYSSTREICQPGFQNWEWQILSNFLDEEKWWRGHSTTSVHWKKPHYQKHGKVQLEVKPSFLLFLIVIILW